MVSDFMWQLLVLVFPILVSIALAFWSDQRSRMFSKLVWQKISDVCMSPVDSAVVDRAEIEFYVKGAPAKDARLLLVNIKNAGKVPIGKEDYLDGSLLFRSDAKIIHAFVNDIKLSSQVDPDILLTLLKPKNFSTFEFTPFAFNIKDSVQIGIIFEGEGTLKVEGRLRHGIVREVELDGSLSLFSLPLFLLVISVVVTLFVYIALRFLLVSATLNGNAIPFLSFIPLYARFNLLLLCGGMIGGLLVWLVVRFVFKWKWVSQ